MNNRNNVCASRRVHPGGDKPRRSLAVEGLRRCHLRRFEILCFACVSVFVVALAASHCLAEERNHSELPPIFPKALAPGDTVMIVAPAKYLDKERVALAKKRLEKMGFNVRIPAACFARKVSWAAPMTNAPPS